MKKSIFLLILVIIFLLTFLDCKKVSRKGEMQPMKEMYKNKKDAPVVFQMADVDEELAAVSDTGNIDGLEDGVVDGEFNTEEYDRIIENSFKNVLTNPLSTFSIDVDTASYANMRRFLNDNILPPPDALRIEELINYFDYDFFDTDSEHPFSVNLEMTKAPWNKAHDLIMIGLKGKDIEITEIPAMNLVFLLDVSGSMSDYNKLPLLKQAFKILVNKLRPDDRVAIVVYAGASGVVLDSTPGANKEVIVNSLEKLEAGGSTAGAEGIELAYKIAKKNFIESGNNRVILATDGDFNVGPSSDAQLERMIEKKREQGIFLTILGFGMGNYKDSKMEKLSNAGNGNYAYIDNILEAKKVLGTEMWGNLFTIAKDVKIQIEFNPQKIKAYRLIGYENRILNKEDFDDDKKDAGEIGAGHTIVALYETIPAGSSETVPDADKLEYQETSVIASDNMMTLKLRYKEPDEDTSKLIVHRIVQSDVQEEMSSANFKFAAAVAQFGLLMRDSQYKADSSFDNVIELAMDARGYDPEGYRSEFIQLVRTAKTLKSVDNE